MQVIIMEQLSTLNILIPNHSSVTTVERKSDFLVKNYVLWFRMGFLDAGYPQVSGADQVIVPIHNSVPVLSHIEVA